jgi:hypothetical protein
MPFAIVDEVLILFHGQSAFLPERQKIPQNRPANPQTGKQGIACTS